MNRLLSFRVVKTDGPTRFGPTQTGWGLHRADMKSPDENRLPKMVPEPDPVLTFGLSGQPGFFKKKLLCSTL
jgi:hypothetical protein